ncbi:ABC transporter ATP-binding protein [Aestuariivirga sp.]|uniref:ABC transporter ATP-binding protein n=1 Tax=Aestuariivirga sp. TaxID=2650926 RepID=UPI00391C39ED
MNEPFLTIQDLRKSFGEVAAVDGVTLQVRKGEFLSFLGPSGSGKSTTLYAVAGLDMPTAGDVLLDGKSMLATPPHKRNIGMVFQRYTLFPHLRVFENIAFPLRVRGWAEKDITRRVEEMLSLVRLEGFAGRMPAQLSGGQQQRVALARALAYDPPVLLMDEPLAALDKKLRDEIQVEIRRIHQTTGVTILYVTHDQEEALRLSDRIAVFNRGRIEQVGTGRELYGNPATRFVAGFVGDSSFLQAASIEPQPGGRASAIMPDGTRFADVPLHASSREAEGRYELMVRPQAIRFVREGELGLAVTIKDVTFLGDTVSALLATAWGQELWLRMPAQEIGAHAAGQQARVTWRAEDCHLFPA